MDIGGSLLDGGSGSNSPEGGETKKKRVSPHREPDEDEHAAVEGFQEGLKQEAKQAHRYWRGSRG